MSGSGIPDDLTSQVDGIVTDFTTSYAYVMGTLSVSLQGTVLRPGLNYTELDVNTFRVLPAPEAGDSLVVRYQLATAEAWSEYPPP